ncbi:MAG: tripartite tricarboxylate transporter substrate binding protein [Casimicrobiaceae bacterium]
MIGIRAVALLGCGIFCAFGADVVLAQTYPARPVRLVVPAVPGSTSDFVGRTIAAKLGGALGQPVEVENRPGGNEALGADAVAKSPPDGYTLLLASSVFAANPPLQPKLAYDAGKDLAPVALVLRYPQVLVAANGLPLDSVQDVLALAKANPGRIRYASTGGGSSGHLAAEYFKSLTGVQLTHVAFKGMGAALVEIQNEKVQLMFTELAPIEAQVKSGKLKALAVTGPKRIPSALNVPTMIEAGVPDYDMLNWYGVMVAAGTSRAVIDRLNADLRRTLAMPEVRDRLLARLPGADTSVSTPDAFGALLRRELALWAKLVKEMNIRFE